MYLRCTGPPRKKGPAPALRFFAASDSRCAWTSSSDIPTGRPSFGRSTSLGIAVSRSSTLLMPTRSSIAARSASVCDEYGFLFNLSAAPRRHAQGWRSRSSRINRSSLGSFRSSSRRLVPAGAGGLADVGTVIARREQLCELSLVGEAHLDHPAVAVRRAVDELGLLDDLHVALHDLAGDRRVDVGRSFDGLDDSKARVLAYLRALLGKLDEHDIPELLLREVRDADRGHVAVGAHPLVLLRILKIVGNGAHSGLRYVCLTS